MHVMYFFKFLAIAGSLTFAVNALLASDSFASTGQFGQQFKQRLSNDPRFRILNSDDRTQRGTPVTYVGSGPNCDTADLGAALSNAASGSEIRLQNETFNGAFAITSKDLVVIGGFEDCTASTPAFSSTLDGSGNGGNTVLDIFDAGASGGSWTVELENLNIVNGNESSVFERGGGLHIEDDFLVTLTDVVIRNNQSATDGGGIQVTGNTGTSLFIFGDTIIDNNSAGDGGGIACIGPQDQLGVVIDSASIFSNSASRGGGIFSENCLVASHAGGVLQGIVNNQASSGGGGIAALGASEIALIGTSPGFLVEGDPDTAARVAGNSTDTGNPSTGAGGGVWLLEGSRLDAIDARIVSNSADARGGGVDVGSDSTFTMTRSNNGSDCSAFLSGDTLARCSSLEDNFAGFVGGAFATDNPSSTATISQTFIAGNSAGLNASVAELSFGTVRMEANVIRDNPGNQLFRQLSSSELELAWSTVADNTPDDGAPPLVEIRASSPESGIDAPTITRLFSNIFWNAGRDVVEIDTSGGSDFDLAADCLVSHELSSIGSASRSIVADPMFEDPLNDDYHIAHNSPAVDLCDDANAPAEEDLDDQPRGFVTDTPATRFDVGADETQGIVFSDGFES